ncbi:Spy/CpxP family protein refolding chaperone [Thermodesulfobacteriota bacterium]
MKSKNLIVMAALLITLAALSAEARGPGRGHGPGPGGGGPPLCPAMILEDAEIIEGLGLTDEQISALRDLDESTGEESRRIREELDDLHLQMECAFSESTVDQERVVALTDEIAELKAQRFSLNIQNRLQLHTILSADQRETLKSLMEQKRPRGPMRRR